MSLNRRRLPVNGSRVLVLGLAYKPNTGDARESPAVAVVERLVALGAAVRVSDPHVDESALDLPVVWTGASPEEAAAADAVVLLTDHDAFDLAAIGNAAPYILDTRHRVPAGPGVEYL